MAKLNKAVAAPKTAPKAAPKAAPVNSFAAQALAHLTNPTIAPAGRGGASAIPQNVPLQVTAAGASYAPKPSAQNNARSWLFIVNQLTGGAQTRQQLASALGTKYNHAPFVAYCMRRGLLAPTTTPKAKQA